ncbi:MAG: hypothetical protein ACKVII_15665 [Planctomycetales bacterium]|jgi:hypothetical protein
MNENLPSDPLDNLLQDWAEERTVSSEHLDKLQDRIVKAIGDENLSSDRTVATSRRQFATSAVSRPEPPYTRRPISLRRVSLVSRLVGVTLLALLAFIWSAQLADYGHGSHRQAGDKRAEIPDYARLSESQLRERMIVLSEMKGLFGKQLNWLAETDSRFEVGLRDGSSAGDGSLSSGDALEIAVRVIVEERSSSRDEWRRAWSVDVISQSEEVVELAAKDDDQSTMTMWAYVLPDGMVAIDSELSFSENSKSDTTEKVAPFRAAFSSVQKDRQSSEELLNGANGVEYRVFQTVAVLNKKVG